MSVNVALRSRRKECPLRPQISGLIRSTRPASAPLQFLVFAVSLVLVLRYLVTGDGYTAATVSILLKTALLYTIMVTGAIWEKVVFGQYLFAPAFFWEDVVSFVVIALHTLYLYGLLTESFRRSS
jgi:2-vinyl bacteriochlorophyllide hydratase